jgi:hypothetical protein
MLTTNSPGLSGQFVPWRNSKMKKKSAFPSLLPKSYAKGTSNVKGYAKGTNWIQGAVNPAHKGYCTPMTKATCTPRRKALAMRFKKGL